MAAQCSREGDIAWSTMLEKKLFAWSTMPEWLQAVRTATKATEFGLTFSLMRWKREIASEAGPWRA